MENHPRINLDNTVILNSKIILGSFPTWSLTAPDFDKGETLEEKIAERKKNLDADYFYGSSINRFWQWYNQYVDCTITKDNILSIQNSLEVNNIGITDMIINCDRANKSSLDKHLTKRTYNTHFFNYPKNGEKIKILCTSKGVMNEMLLNEIFFRLHDQLKINETKSIEFQKSLINKINGDLTKIRKPFYRHVELETGGSIECISIPSPGSPYRRLVDFGLNESTAEIYLQSYLKEAFNWFLKL